MRITQFSPHRVTEPPSAILLLTIHQSHEQNWDDGGIDVIMTFFHTIKSIFRVSLAGKQKVKWLESDSFISVFLNIKSSFMQDYSQCFGIYAFIVLIYK